MYVFSHRNSHKCVYKGVKCKGSHKKQITITLFIRFHYIFFRYMGYLLFILLCISYALGE